MIYKNNNLESWKKLYLVFSSKKKNNNNTVGKNDKNLTQDTAETLRPIPKTYRSYQNTRKITQSSRWGNLFYANQSDTKISFRKDVLCQASITL